MSVVNSPAPAQAMAAPGNYVAFNQAFGKFEVLDVKDFGLKDNNKQHYEIKVRFFDGGNGKIAVYDTYSSNLESAEEMIEYIGRQIKGYDRIRFNDYVKENDNKPHFFNLTENADGSSTVICYIPDGHGHYLKEAFDLKPVKKIKKGTRDWFKTVAENWRSTPSGRVINPGRITAVLNPTR